MCNPEDITQYPDTDECIALMEKGDYPREKLHNSEVLEVNPRELCSFFDTSIRSKGRYSFLNE